MNSYTIWFIVFALISYFIVTDDSVAKTFYMFTQLIGIQYQKIKWWIFNNPKNPIIKYLIWRRSYKLAEELQKEFAKKDNKV
jgi:hypothetical protein